MAIELLPLLAPLTLAASAVVGFLNPGRRPRVALAWAEPGSLAALAQAMASAGVAIAQGPSTSILLGTGGMGWSVRLDAVSSIMFLLVAFIGWAVVRFAKTYLDGEDRQGAFLGWLNLTLASVLLLVLAGNLFQLVFAWSMSSLCLHRLLIFYPDRVAARRAAHRKFVMARISDVALIASGVMLAAAYGTTDIATILHAARAGHGGWLAMGAAYLLVLAAMLKSAQFPAHGWLTEVMEAPTPVSALLHAGVINAGGFLLVRLADVMLLAPGAVDLLALIGGFTALFGGMVMLTQSAVKTSLAWSTVAQMGFMMLECGLGLFPLALLHIVAHSLYKAHSFLSSGGAVDVIAANRRPGRVAIPDVAAVGRAFVLALAIYAILALALEPQGKTPQAMALGAILIFGVAYLLAQGLADAAPVALTRSTATYTLAASVSYFAAQALITALTRDVLPATPSPGPFGWILLTLSVISFGVVALAQAMLPLWSAHPAVAGLRVHLANGFYANVVLDRWLGSWSQKPKAEAADMSEPPALSQRPVNRDALDRAVDSAACAIPPAWPLASSVAVNPFLGQASEDLATVSARLGRVVGTSATMPRRWYADRIRSGEISDADLSAALASAPQPQRPLDLVALKAEAFGTERAVRPTPTIADLAAAMSGIDWPGLIETGLGAWAAGYFDEGQALWGAPRFHSAYAAWRAYATRDYTPDIIGLPGFSTYVRGAPDNARESLAWAAQRLDLEPAAMETYFHQLLMTWGGWAQYARYKQWQAALTSETDQTLVDLLAIRLVWEAALLDRYRHQLSSGWAMARSEHASPVTPTPAQVIDALLQEASERAAQRRLAEALAAPAAKAPDLRPALQAVFCIDVRSEVFRRALEGTHAGIQTLGFAGFFGIPLAHRRFASDTAERRLPVLLNPGFQSHAGGAANAAKDASARIRARGRRAWGRFKLAAVSSFAFVEATGLLYVVKLVRHALGLWDAPTSHDPMPHFDPLPDLSSRIKTAQTVLRAMSLTGNFARLVMLVGHDANVVNNPHASGLRCGACGGYSGEANARLLATLLNDPEVREGLAAAGIPVPADTLFVGAVHDTTADTVTVFVEDHPSEQHRQELSQAQTWLQAAGRIARAERSLRLPRASHAESITRRGNDWAEIRPEWGLTGCQAFIAAPRQRSAGKNFHGRVFLHDYDWKKDRDHGVLELIMTAPVVVASWISLQYYGSTVAPRVFGGGNKLLHNVTGGIGVVEGNGGVLRTGLPWQSVHDGERYAHDPLRLAVYIEAPRAAMSDILKRHDGVRALFDNRWLHLFALDDEGTVAWRYAGNLEWVATDASSEPVHHPNQEREYEPHEVTEAPLP